MLSRVKNVMHFSLRDPGTVIVVSVLVFLSVVTVWGFRFSELAVRLLPAMAIALCISLLLVPKKNLSVLLVMLAGMSIPFAHFALYIAMGEGIQWMHLFGAILIFHLIARMILGHKIKIAPSMPWVVGIVFASFVSLLGSINGPGEQITEFWKSEVQLLFAVLVYFAVTQVRIENKHLLLMFKILILVSVGVALFGFYQLPARFFGWPGGVMKLTNPSLSGATQNVDIIFYMIRSSSIFSEPSYYGHYMNGMIAINLIVALHRPRLFGKPFITWIILGIQMLALFVSFAMSSFYILGLLLLFVFLTERVSSKLGIIGGVAVMLVLSGIVLALIESLSGFSVLAWLVARSQGIWFWIMTGDKSNLTTGESIFQRYDTTRIAMAVWADNPVFGVGLGSYPLVSPLYGDYNPQGFSANALVNTFAEMGLTGVTALFGIIISSLYGLWRVIKYYPRWLSKDDPEFIDILLLSRMLFFLILIEMLYFHVQGSFFWPSVWYYLGLGGLIAIKAQKFKAQATHKA